MISPSDKSASEQFEAAFPDYELTHKEFHALWEQAGSQARLDYTLLENMRWQIAQFGMLVIDSVKNKAGALTPVWRSMEADPPTETGRYCVGHRGSIFGHAFYTARKGDTHYPVGWEQVPPWRPSHWLYAPRIEKKAQPVLHTQDDERYPEPVTNFHKDQWWVKELDALVQGVNITMDQKRAVAVVHHLLQSIEIYERKE